MASKTLFRTSPGKLAPKADAVNEAGGAAYALAPRQALANYAATGCLSTTFYASAEAQLDTILGLCGQVEPEWIARTAVYARERAVMKDLPALLAAALSVRSADLLRKVFPRVIDSPKMLRNFVQIVRSGAVGRKSLGTVPKRLVLRWLDERSDEQLFHGSIGNAPSLADVLRMVHPKPATKSREALYGWLLGREVSSEALPAGGTNCSAPLRYLNERREKGDLVVYVSDNESWVDSPSYGYGGSATETMRQWEAFRQRNPAAKMLAIDIQPNATVQAKERQDIVNVGGFSDHVFQVIADVAAGRSTAGYWVRQIESIDL